MKNFFKFSLLLGRDEGLVQGAGGNTSVKIGTNLSVKASGYFLKDVRKGAGYVTCNYGKIVKYLERTRTYRPSLEQEFETFGGKILDRKKSFGRPSIETGMHAVIPSKYVFHTHSVMANVLNFAEGGDDLIKKIFAGTDFGIIKYNNPGLELALALTKELKTKGRLPRTIFLTSHGLVTHHDDAQKAYQLTLDAQSRIIAYLKKQKSYQPFKVNRQAADLSRHMFPDSVVYSQINFANLPKAKQRVFYEICSLVNYTRSAIGSLGLKPVFLPAMRVKFLKGMAQEQHRINLFEKAL